MKRSTDRNLADGGSLGGAVAAALACLALGCSDELTLPNDAEPSAPDGGSVSPPEVHDPVPSRVWLGDPSPIRVEGNAIRGEVRSTTCAYDRCLVSYETEGGDAFGFWLRRPDGAVIGGLLDLEGCTGLAASDGHGFAVLCDEGLIRLRADGTTRRIHRPGGHDDARIIHQDEAYLVADLVRGDRLRISRLEDGSDGPLTSTGCCDSEVDGSLGLHFVATDAGPVVARVVPSEGPHLLLISRSGDEVQRWLSPATAREASARCDESWRSCLFVWDAAASVGSKVLLSGIWFTGDGGNVNFVSASSFVLDRRTGDVTQGAPLWSADRVEESFLPGALRSVDDSYYVALSEDHLQRLKRDGDAVDHETSELPIGECPRWWDWSECGVRLAPLGPARFAVLEERAGELTMTIVEYEPLARP